MTKYFDSTGDPINRKPHIPVNPMPSAPATTEQRIADALERIADTMEYVKGAWQHNCYYALSYDSKKAVHCSCVDCQRYLKP